ncbi:MAG: 3-oxoacyl-[acyl-carrier-protein] synthase III C-terminal domain-containing protein [Pseudomonadota bacterium]
MKSALKTDRPRLLALASATPPFAFDQTDVARRAAVQFPRNSDIDRLLPVFNNAGIDTRYSCVPVEWYMEPHGWKDRTDLFLEHAQNLLEQVTHKLLKATGLGVDDIDAIVAASTTGVATPSLDALMIERLKLRRDVARLPIFGLGCAGGVLGLARAADMARARPGARVLFLVVELCALTFRKNDYSKSNIVATALFGDGAAGAIISTAGDGPVLGASGEHTWPHSLDVMGWDIEEDGLKARFAQNIPALVSSDFRAILDHFLKANDLDLKDIDQFACHPGGAKVLEALEEALTLENGALADSRDILREYGNMSAVTALFVLERMRAKGPLGHVLMTALGPGFSACFLELDGR